MEKLGIYESGQPKMNKIKSVKGNFKCGCGDEVDHEFISVHMNDWPNMSDQYSDLFNSLNVLIEDGPTLSTWNNIQAISRFFKSKLERIIDDVSSHSPFLLLTAKNNALIHPLHR
jgi:hypothetical protein